MRTSTTTWLFLLLSFTIASFVLFTPDTTQIAHAQQCPQGYTLSGGVCMAPAGASGTGTTGATGANGVTGPTGGGGYHPLIFAIGNPLGAALTTSNVSNSFGIPFGCTIGNPTGQKYTMALGPGDVGPITVEFRKVATGGSAIPTHAASISTAGLTTTGTLKQGATFTDFISLVVNAADTMQMAVTATSGNVASVTVTLPCQ